MQTSSMTNPTAKYDNNWSHVEYSSYMIELNNKLSEMNNYIKKLNVLSVNSWNHIGEKKWSFTESLLNCIELYWDNIFDNDSTNLNIKGRVVNSISGFLHQPHESLCEYSWELAVKQYINESIHDIYNSNNYGDIMVIKEQYLNKLDKFNILVKFVLSQYGREYSIRKTNYISKYKFMNRLAYMRPIFLYINRHYYKLFDFSNSRQLFLKSILYQTISFIQIITSQLNCKIMGSIINEKEREYMILVRSTFQITRNLIESKYPKFIGLILTRLFYKDVALHITEYL